MTKITTPLVQGKEKEGKAESSFEFKYYDESFSSVWHDSTLLFLPHQDNFKYVLWEKEYVTRWYISKYKAKLADTIRMCRYKAYPDVGRRARKLLPGEALSWTKANFPNIVLMHMYENPDTASATVQHFPDEFEEARMVMRGRARQMRTYVSASTSPMGLLAKKLVQASNKNPL